MPPHYPQSNIIPFAPAPGANGGQPAPPVDRQPFGVPHIPLEHMAKLTRDAGMQQGLRDPIYTVTRKPLTERIADALDCERFFLLYVGFYAGCFATVGLAYLWRWAS